MDAAKRGEEPAGPDRPYLKPDGTFDSQAFLDGLDAIFNAGKARDSAEPYLLQALADAENAGDEAGLLTVLNETMGFYRSQGRHEDNKWMIQRAIELAAKMGIEGTQAWTTTLINAATGLRAAHEYEQAEDLYRQALKSSEATFGPGDRRLAALHNNLSMLYSETGRLADAVNELEEALSILESSSPDPTTDLDVASTHTNLALALLQEASAGRGAGDLMSQADRSGSADRNETVDRAMKHAEKSMEIYRHGHLEGSAHYASALAGYAQALYFKGDFTRAAATYRKALSIIEDRYGRGSDYYKITEENLNQVLEAGGDRSDAGGEGNAADRVRSDTAGRQGQEERAVRKDHGNQGKRDMALPDAGTSAGPAKGTPSYTHPHACHPAMTGLQLSKAYWEEYGKPLIQEKYKDYEGRIAAGLMGHGSECYGFDDAVSRDHDFGPGFCLWLTHEDNQAIGASLQADYEALPQDFMGYGPRESSVRARGAGRRVGVFEIGDFFQALTGYRQAPADDRPHEWLLLDEATLAAATNGQVFADPLGQLLATRQGFKSMPDDVRLSLISRRLGMIAQAGQYNLPRSLERGDGAAAMLSINEFVNATASLVFLINNPITVGYLPYYKWRFAALHRLSARMASRLGGVADELETVLRLASAACYGGAGFGEGGRGAGPAAGQIHDIVEHICSRIVTELREEGLTSSRETFLEWQRPYVEAHIDSEDPVLHSI